MSCTIIVAAVVRLVARKVACDVVGDGDAVDARVFVGGVGQRIPVYLAGPVGVLFAVPTRALSNSAAEVP